MLINVGLIIVNNNGVRAWRSVQTFPVKLSKEMNYEEVYERSMKKWEDYDRTFSRDRGYILVYPDDKIARTIPGS